MAAVGRAAYLRQCVEMSLRRLGVERIDLYQLHRIDEQTPMEESLGELKALQDEGKIRHIGLSEVDVPTLEAAATLVDVVSVQNLYNLVDRGSEDVLDWATDHDVAFIPWFPLKASRLSSTSGPLAEASRRHGATPSQLALAWLLRRSPAVLPIPGTGSVAHLEENLAAAGIELTDEEFAALG